MFQGGAALLLGFSVAEAGRRLIFMQNNVFKPNAFLRIDSEGVVTALMGPTEMGQGIHTALAQVLAEELDVDWSKVRVEPAPVDPVYGNPILNNLQATEASVSMVGFYATTRRAGAAARSMLVAAAAADWGVPVDRCRTAQSFVICEDGRRAAYGSLVAAASKLKPPADESLKLKSPDNFKLIGKAVDRLDLVDQVNAQVTYGVDFTLPDMLVASVAHAPVPGAKIKTYDRSAKAMPRVRDIVEIPSGLAVIAEDYWAARTARDKLAVEWDIGAAERYSTKTLEERHRALLDTSGSMAADVGKADEIIAAGSNVVRMDYLIPYLAHVPMEPLNCIIRSTSEQVDVWTGTQDQGAHHELLCKAFARPPEQVTLHTLPMGGGFGRRGSPNADFIIETAEIVKATRHLNRPIQNIWSRSDDLQGGFYRAMAANRFEVVLDGQGLPTAWRHRIAARSILSGTSYQFLVVEGIDLASVAGARDLPYDVPNLKVELHSPNIGPTVMWLRSVGNSNVAFAVESFIDELARRKNEDPVAYRRRLLKGKDNSERLVRVMEAAAKQAGWDQPLPRGRGRGIAVHDFWGTKVAQVAEVSLAGDRITVERITCAVDCGRVVNPDGVCAQIEGGIIYGLSGALYGEITFADGLPQQSNFHDFPILRMDATPKIDVVIVASDADPGGIGEVAVPHVAPALCNAIVAAGGRRIRRLPIGGQGYTV